MKRLLALCVEPANYTLDLIETVYRPRHIDVSFLKQVSKASDITAHHIFRVWDVVRVLRKYDGFILHSYSQISVILLVVLNRVFFHKLYVIDVDSTLRLPKSWVMRRLKHILLSFLFGASYAYGIAPGTTAHRAFFLHYGMFPERLFVLPLVVKNERYMRVLPTLPHQPFRFGYLGRLVWWKGVDAALEVFVALHKEVPSIAFDIIGDGPECERLEEKYKCHPAITFHGVHFGEGKVVRLHTLDCLVLNSSYEPWGLVVNEALASGIPCIVSDCVGCRDDLICGDMPTGIVVPEGNRAALIEAMRAMYQETAQYKAFQKAALQRMARWSYASYTEAFDALLARLGFTNG